MKACHSGNRKVCVVRIMQANLRENMSFSTAWRPPCRWMEIDVWYRSTLDRGCQQSVDRVSAYRPTSRRLSSDTWVGRHSTDYRPLLVECRSCIGRHVDRVSIASIDRHSTASVISTQLISINFWQTSTLLFKSEALQFCSQKLEGETCCLFKTFNTLLCEESAKRGWSVAVVQGLRWLEISM